MKELKYREEVRRHMKCAACGQINDEMLYEFCQKCGQSLAALVRIYLCPFCGLDMRKWGHDCDAEPDVLFWFDGSGDYSDDYVIVDDDGDPWLLEYYMNYDLEESRIKPVDWDWVRARLAIEITKTRQRITDLVDAKREVRRHHAIGKETPDAE